MTGFDRLFRLASCGVCGALALLYLGAAPAGAAPVGVGFTVDFLVAPGDVAGDVVVVGDAVFVGVGSFGVGGMSVVRIDAGGSTVIADGFNALAGFAYDAVNDRLLVLDNGGNLSGAITGDTLYGIPDPVSALASAAATSLELLPSGSIPGAADLVLDPTDATGNSLFITDATGDFPPTQAALVAVVLGTPATLTAVQSLQLAAGLATDGATLFFGDVSPATFAGRIQTSPVADPAAAPFLLAEMLAGQFDLEVAADGTLLSSSGGEVLAIASDGGTSPVATGFGFATGLFAAPDGRFFALDGGPAAGESDRIWVFTPVPEPGSALLLGLGLLGLARRRRTA